MKALEIRRKVTAEIFKRAMRKGKFGITYSTNVTERLTDFIDYVMIKAAALKKLPAFAESTFNVRAKTVIEDSHVVPLIRYEFINGCIGSLYDGFVGLIILFSFSFMKPFFQVCLVV